MYNDFVIVHILCPNAKGTLVCYRRFRWYAKLENKTPAETFPKFPQACVLSTDRIEIHQSQPLVWPSDLLDVMLAGCDWWISIRSVNDTQDWRKFWKRFRGCCFPKSRINENGGKRPFLCKLFFISMNVRLHRVCGQTSQTSRLHST